MHFQFKMPENGRKKRLRGKKTTNKALLMSLVVKVLTKRYQVRFLNSVNKEAKYSVCN